MSLKFLLAFSNKGEFGALVPVRLSTIPSELADDSSAIKSNVYHQAEQTIIDHSVSVN